GVVTLYDLRTGQARGNLGVVAGDLEFSPDGSLCAAEVGTRKPRSSSYGPSWEYQVEGVRLWDVGAGRELALLRDAQGPLLFSPDGKTVAGTEGNPSAPVNVYDRRRAAACIKVWEAATGRERARIDRAAQPLLFQPGGDALLVRQPDALTLWDLAAGRARSSLRMAPPTPVISVWSPGKPRPRHLRDSQNVAFTAAGKAPAVGDPDRRGGPPHP